MKRITTCLLLTIGTLLCGCATAQTLDNFKDKAARADSVHSSRINISEHGNASAAVRTLEPLSAKSTIRGYRVSIYIGNSQNSRSVSQAELNRFTELFPDIPAYRTYVYPDYKVTAGNCLSSDEAIIIWGRVKSAFDRASVIREEIPISSFATKVSKKIGNVSNSEELSQ